MQIIDDFYENPERPRQQIITEILEAGVLTKDLTFEQREKGFNSTPNLNVLIGNFGNFRRSSKGTHPRISPSGCAKANGK